MGLDIYHRNDVSFQWAQNQPKWQYPVMNRMNSDGLPAVNSVMRNRLEPRATWQRRRRFLFRALVLAAAIQGGTWGLAAADDRVVRADTASIAPAATERSTWENGLIFETSAHRAWYNVFWTGKCDELPWIAGMMCVKGRPTWTEITQLVVGKAKPDARTDMHDKMIRLGRMIGHEWARHNDDRRINNDDLQLWSGWLEKSADVDGTVNRLAEAALGKLDQR